MKRNTALRLSFLLFVLFLLMGLTACVRTIKDDGGGGSELPTAEPLVMPTAVPIDTPVPEPTAVIEDTTTTEDATDANAGETTDAGQPADTGDAANTGETTDTGQSAENPGAYTVQSGDTLGEIAEQFGVSMDALAAANGITNLDTLDVGQVLTIPTGTDDTATAPETPDTSSTEEQVHIVKAGENLFRIGLAYGFSVDELADYNGITNPDSLEVGQEVRIPPSN